jgi:heme exporter protein A
VNPTPPLLLCARGLSCRRGGRLLFSGFDLEVSGGQAVWLRGDNGRGKTSLLRLLAGLVEPDSGEVQWQGRRAQAVRADGAQPLYVAHANALKDDLSVHEALVLLARLSTACDAADDARLRASIDAALERVGLARQRGSLVRALSQGQRRRAALARLALPSRARVWLLDEPYDALDAASTSALNDILRGHVARGGAIVMTSHQPLGADAPAHVECWLRARSAQPATGAVVDA